MTIKSEILIFPLWPPNQATKSSAEMADLVRGNPWGLVIIFGKSYFLVLSKIIGNLSQKTVGYPSRKVVEHIFFEHQIYGLISTKYWWENVKYLVYKH